MTKTFFRGIGHATAALLAAQGAHVVLTGKDGDEAGDAISARYWAAI